MNKNEAQQSLLQGNKLTHPFFTPDEFIEVKDGYIYTEEGYSAGHFGNRFWQDKTGEYWDKDWTLFNEPKIKL